MKRFRTIFVLVGSVLAVVFLFFAWKNSLVVTSVSIQTMPGIAEHLDHSVMGFGAEHRLPDYKVTLRVNRKFLPLDLGTKLNTSATNWVEFAVAEVIPIRNLQEVIVIEDDKVENDVLDRIQPQGESFAGTAFSVKLTTERSFDAGLSWFFNTPVGKAISTGIVVAIVLIISSFF